MKIFYVYALCYSNGRIFYIGKGKGTRCYNSALKSGGNKYKKHVIAQIINKGRKPLIKFLYEDLSERAAHRHEKRLIKFYGKRIDGIGRLVNLTDGGEGTSGYCHTKKTRKIISKTSSERTHVCSKEARAKISKAKKGVKHSKEYGEVRSKGLKKAYREGRRKIGHSEETCKKISELKKGKHKGKGNPFYGKSHSKVSRAINSRAHLGKNNVRYGKKHSKETIEKMSKARKKFWKQKAA